MKRKGEEKGYIGEEGEKEREGETTTPTLHSSLSHVTLSQLPFGPSILYLLPNSISQEFIMIDRLHSQQEEEIKTNR